MKKLLLALLISFSVYAQNPVIFAALGDVIYNDVDKFGKLSNLPAMRDFKPAIDEYLILADKSKKMGFAVDSNDGSGDAKVYLKELRSLSTKHDTIVLNARKRFEEAIQDQDSETMSSMIKIGIVNPKDYKNQLIQYYEDYSEDQNLSVIEPLYKEYKFKLSCEENASKSGAEAAKNAEAEVVNRMRATDKASKEALTRSVKEECDREKQSVIQEQKKALGVE
ncbi:hypothetical protein KKB18_03520 [bacterium]|nr:hypothetical protein [bacterium]